MTTDQEERHDADGVRGCQVWRGRRCGDGHVQLPRPEVTEFAETLEQVVVESVESGKMIKDLALLVGEDQEFQTTEEFLATLDENLQKKMAAR